MVVFYKSLATAQEEWILIHKHQHKTQSLLQSKTPPKRRRTVTFAEPLVTTTHAPAHDMTIMEKELCFYDRRDRYLFEQDRVQTALAYDAACRKQQPWVESNVQTARGLEDFFLPVCKETARQEHVHAVLRAAAVIRFEEAALSSSELADTLRYVSSELSSKARRRAADLGAADEQAVRLLWL